MSAQIAPSAVAPAAAISAPLTHPMVKDLALCTVQADPPLPTTATMPKHPVKKSFAQAAKASAPMPPDKPNRASASTPTQPFAPVSAPANSASGPFKGQRATKPNKLHVQLHSHAAFNSSLLKYMDLKLNHRHALLDAFINAISTKITKKTHSYFLDNRIEAAFWSPCGNLIIRMKCVPSVQLQTLLLDTIEMICGGKNFVILTRPTLSLLKLCSVPTRNPDSSAVDAELIAAKLFHDTCITKASFWHLPRFVYYKGNPLGRTGTIFFSLVDSPQYALGRSLINTTVSIFGTDFKILRWIPVVHDQSTMNIALGGTSFYKEHLPTPAPPTTIPSSTTRAPLPPSAAAPRHPSTSSPRLCASPSLAYLHVAMVAHSDIKRDYPNLFASFTS